MLRISDLQFDKGAMMKQQFVVGLVGHVCTGKSAVAAAFQRRGAWIFDADKLVHAIYTQPNVIAEVTAEFGNTVLNNHGAVDRSKLGRIVFHDAAKLKMLTEQIIFPRTCALLDTQLAEFRASAAPALVLDAPTLFEAGREHVCDYILFVSAPIRRRQEWAAARGWDCVELSRREARMTDEAVKRAQADALIDNSGSLDELDRKVEELFTRWSSVAPNSARTAQRPAITTKPQTVQ